MQWSLSRLRAVLAEMRLSVVKEAGDKLVLSCPFPERHRGGRDAHPSCSAFLTPRGGAYYRCFACGSAGPILALIWELGLRPQWADYPIKALALASDVEPHAAPTVAVRDYRPGGPLLGEALFTKGPGPTVQLRIGGGEERPKRAPYVPPPEEQLARWQALPMPEYAVDRGIDAATYRAWGLGYHEARRRLIVPVRDQAGVLIGYTGRLVWGEPWCFRCGRMLEDDAGCELHVCPDCHTSFAKYFHTPGMPKREVLCGAHLHRPGDPVVLVEGPLDAINLYGLGVRAPMACLGASPSATQLELALALAGEAPVIAMGDGDEAGRRMNAEIVRVLGDRARVVELPEGVDPGQLRGADFATFPGLAGLIHR
jgi:hypothetical protein